jgi:hypothetical protein
MDKGSDVFVLGGGPDGPSLVDFAERFMPIHLDGGLYLMVVHTVMAAEAMNCHE